MSELTKRTDDDDELPGCLALAQGIAEQRWPHTMDAQLWAVKWKEAIAANPAIPNDEGTMIGWFANAIMAGYDTAQMRSLRQPEREGWQPISTAPKDGTCILVSNEYGSWIAKYVPEYQSGYRPAVPWMSMMLNHDHMRWGVRALVPTNWQPLPALQSEEK